MKRKYLLIMAALIIVFTLSTCENIFKHSVNNQNTDDILEYGSLSVILETMNMDARTISPPIDMTVSSYDISGSGPDFAMFSETGYTGSTYTAEGLIPGTWTVEVSAYNAGGEQIGYGFAQTAIEAGNTNSVTVPVRIIEGQGTLSVSISWPSGEVDTPVIEAFLTPDGGNEAEIEFNISGTTASFDNTAIDTGSYLLSVSFFDGGAFRCGRIEAFRIIAGETTTISFELTSDDLMPMPTLDAPTFDPPAGTYGVGKSVTIDSTESTATIKYTTNGSVPSRTNGLEYTGDPISVGSTTTLNAMCYLAGYNDSDVTEAAYDITGSVATPIITPQPGLYYDPVEVSLSSTTDGAIIMYTTNGADPAYNFGSVFNPDTPIPINTGEVTVKALAKNTSNEVSDIIYGTYRITGHMEAPTVDMAEGTYYDTFQVTITPVTAGSTVKYTTDGSNPSLTNGTEYSAPVTIDRTTTLRTIAMKTDWGTSDILTLDYVLQPLDPVFSVEAGSLAAPADLTITCDTEYTDIIYTDDGTGPSLSNGSYYSAAIELDGNVTIKAVAVRTGWTDSGIVSNTYSFVVAAPAFTPQAGNFIGNSLDISLSTMTDGADIIYTTDGNDPSPTNGAYETFLTINRTTTVKAIAHRPGWTNSQIATTVYTAGADPAPTDGATIFDMTPLLDWADLAGAVRYELQIADTSLEIENAIILDAATMSEYQVPINSAFSYGNTKYWRVRGVNTDGVEGDWTINIVLFVSQGIAVNPSPMDGAIASSVLPLLDWDDVNGAATYNIQVNSNIGFDGTMIVDQTGISESQFQVIENLDYAANLYWRVRSIDVIGELGSWSNTWNLIIPPISIGDTFGGGVVFYLDGFGSGLVAAEDDHSSATIWGDYNTLIEGTSRFVGTGAANTIKIVSVLGDYNYAANLCNELIQNGYDDWFLPSSEELNLMYENKEAIGGFASNYYWSSSENDTNKAFSQDFGNGQLSSSLHKLWTLRIRAIRAFSDSIVSLGAPSNPFPIDGTNSDIICPLLDWEDVIGADYYYIEVNTVPGFDGLMIANAAGLTESQFVISADLNYGMTYYWRVCVMDNLGATGTWSGPWSFVTPPLYLTDYGFGLTEVIAAGGSGSFEMGSASGNADELPVHTVSLTQAYDMSTYEITNEQAAVVFNAAFTNGWVTASASTLTNASGNSQELLDLDDSYCEISYSGGMLVVDSGKEDYPVLEITWYGAVAFCYYLNVLDGKEQTYDLADWSCDFTKSGFRLPTEAEWEYAARGGSLSEGYTYAGSDTIDDVAWYNGNAGGWTHPVGQKQENELGLYDMSGNLYEWCNDWYSSNYYTISPESDPEGAGSGTDRVVRGGYWLNSAYGCRVAFRSYGAPPFSYYYFGFRPVLARSP
jgi:formylglycine-generating enzyme required for sulfatase activity